MGMVIRAEAELFIHAFLLGVLLAAINDILAILRGLWHRNTVAVAIVDVLFWIFAGLLLTAMIYQENDGRIRGFFFIGISAGIFVQCICRKFTGRLLKRKRNIDSKAESTANTMKQ